jgi:hypothetical protein
MHLGGNAMFDMIQDPSFWGLVAIYWVFNALVGAMPTPDQIKNIWYKSLYQFLHTLAGNVTSAFGSKVPGSKKVK